MEKVIGLVEGRIKMVKRLVKDLKEMALGIGGSLFRDGQVATLNHELEFLEDLVEVLKLKI